MAFYYKRTSTEGFEKQTERHHGDKNRKCNRRCLSTIYTGEGPLFLSLQKVMEQIILYDGDNQFKLPHLKKNALMVRGMLPESPDVSDELRAKIESLDPTEIESVEDEEVVDLEPEVDVEAALI